MAVQLWSDERSRQHSPVPQKGSATMIPPEIVKALKSSCEMAKVYARSIDVAPLQDDIHRQAGIALAYLDTLPAALDAANQRIAELESRSAHLEELLEGQEMARQSLEAKIKYLNTELQAYSNAYHRTLPPGSTRTRRKGDSHE